MSGLAMQPFVPSIPAPGKPRVFSWIILAFCLFTAISGSQLVYADFFDSSSVWNSALPPSPPLAPNSDALIQTSFSGGANGGRLFISLNDYSVPVYYATAATPTHTVPVSYPWSPYNVPGPGFGEAVPIPANAQPASGSDGHMVVVDLERRLAWDFYQAQKTATGWKTTYGIRWNLDGSGKNSVWTAGARAAGTPLLGGLILYDEIQAGRISHALSMAIPQIRDKEIISPPASATQKGSINPNYLPMGSRVQLDPGLNLNAYNLSPAGRVVARALQEYGAFIVDCSGTNVLYAESLEHDSSRSWQGILSATALMNIPFGELRVISASKLAGGTAETPTPTKAATSTPQPTPIPTHTPTSTVVPEPSPDPDTEEEPTPTPFPVVITAASTSTMAVVSAFSASSAFISICPEP